MTAHDVGLTVDGERTDLAVEPRTLLVTVLRDAGHTAPKVGCDSGTCGACTVRLDGDAVKSCTVLAVQADGSTVTTVAGLQGAAGDDEEDDTADHPVQRAFHEEHALQCGYCTPGMVMTVVDLLADEPDPDRATIRDALKGNVCRCTGYHNIVNAVERAAADLDALEFGPDGDGSHRNRGGVD